MNPLEPSPMERRTLLQAVESVQSQTYDWDYIIVNNQREARLWTSVWDKGQVDDSDDRP